MTAHAIVEKAARLGVSLSLTPNGTIKVIGDASEVEGLIPLIKDFKSEIIQLLNAKNIDFAKYTGLPCGGCGATAYTKSPKGYQYPDGTLTDGWHCGGNHCHVKLMLTASASSGCKQHPLNNPLLSTMEQ